MSETPSSSRPAVVLVHGAWAGPWVWDDVAARLRSVGLRVETPDQLGPEGTPAAGESFDAAVGRIVAAIDACGGPVMVVGHSGGGVLASAAAEARPDLVETVVYVAGFMTPSGVHYSEVVAQLQAESPDQASLLTGIGAHLVWSAERDATSAPPEAALQIFFHDCPPEAAQRAAARLRPYPEAIRATAPTFTQERFGRARRVYVECLDDRSIVLATQRRLQALSPGARRISIDCGHAPMLAAPEEMTASLLSALDDGAAGPSPDPDHALGRDAH